jgi:hypothetical protein
MFAKAVLRSSVRALASLQALVAFSASAQGVLTYSDQLAQADALYEVGTTTFGNSGITRDLTGVDFHAIESRPYSAGGFTGKGYAEHGATFFPSNPGINGPFFGAILDACTSAEITRSTIGPHSYEEAYGLASGVIEFDIFQPHFWSWAGGWQGASFNTGAYNLVNAEISFSDTNSGASYVYDYRASTNAIGDWVQNFALWRSDRPWKLPHHLVAPVLLRRRQHAVRLLLHGRRRGAPLISCINSTFQITPVPAPRRGGRCSCSPCSRRAGAAFSPAAREPAPLASLSMYAAIPRRQRTVGRRSP